MRPSETWKCGIPCEKIIQNFKVVITEWGSSKCRYGSHCPWDLPWTLVGLFSCQYLVQSEQKNPHLHGSTSDPQYTHTHTHTHNNNNNNNLPGSLWTTDNCRMEPFLSIILIMKTQLCIVFLRVLTVCFLFCVCSIMLHAFLSQVQSLDWLHNVCKTKSKHSTSMLRIL